MGRLRSPWLTALLLGILAAGTYAVPGLARVRPLTAARLSRTFLDPWRGRPPAALWRRVEREPLPEPARPPERRPALAPVTLPTGAPALPATPAPLRVSYADLPQPAVRAGDLALPEGTLDVPDGALDGFEKALSRAAQGDGPVRITHFGDSPVTGDLITGEARAQLQRLLGDAGHGFVLAGQPWEWYGHLGVEVRGEGWRVRTPMLGQREPLGGLAAVRFTTSGKARTRVSCARWVKSAVVEVHYLAGPRGGSLSLDADGAEVGRIDTHADVEEPRLARFTLPEDGSHQLELRARGDGEVTVYGLVLEREGPGVVYDALGANGAAIFHLASLDAEHWEQSLRLRRPDLVVLAYGTNEAGYYPNPGAAYRAAYREVIRRVREALPDASVLVMAPMDRAATLDDGALATMPSLKRIVAAQRQASREAGVAFFDTWTAMGGEGSALRWYERLPRLMTSDFTHPTRPGAERLARLLTGSLRRHWEARLAQADREPAASPAPGPSPAPTPTPAPQASPAAAGG